MTSSPAEELKAIRLSMRLTQPAMAERLGVAKSRYQNWEYGKVEIPNYIMDLAIALRKGDDVGRPTAPVPTVKLRIPYIGLVAASEPVSWSDPFESIEWEDVPYEMGDVLPGQPGRFSARVVGLSMFPLLLPDDLLVFKSSNVPKLGIVVMHRSNDNRVSVKCLKQEGVEFFLESVNPEVKSIRAEGMVIGHLVGIVRHQGSRITTEYDPNGIRP